LLVSESVILLLLELNILSLDQALDGRGGLHYATSLRCVPLRIVCLFIFVIYTGWST